MNWASLVSDMDRIRLAVWLLAKAGWAWLWEA